MLLLCGLVGLMPLLAPVLGATCNLLESGNAAYIDTESESSIVSMCSSSDTSSLSEWEQYQCEYIKNRDGWEKCWPQRRLSTCSPGELKGVAIFFHGYSACPDQYNNFAPMLQDECWHVYLPLTVGHGYAYCNGPTNNTIDGCSDGYNLTTLPMKREAYLEWIDWMIDVTTDELSIIKQCELDAGADQSSINDINVSLGGLSLGAALSASAMARSPANLFTKQVLMSPFLGISYQGADELVYKCALNQDDFRECLPMYFEAIGVNMSTNESTALGNLVMDVLADFVNIDAIDTSYETLNWMVRKIVEWIVENPEDVSADYQDDVNSVLDTMIGWGTECEQDQINQNRGGFCKFTVRQLAAAHSLGQWALENTGKSGYNTDVIDTLWIMVERDGATRNSMVAQYTQLLYQYNTTNIIDHSQNCIWLIAESCQQDSSITIDNSCGVPHSSMSRKDNVDKGPIWWNDTYYDGLLVWLTDEGSYPDNFASSEGWDGSRDMCLSLSMIDPPAALIADIPQWMTIAVDLGEIFVSETIFGEILDTISDLTGVPRGVLELTYSVVENSESSLHEFDVFMTGESAEKLELLSSNGLTTMITVTDEATSEQTTYDVVSVTVSGNQYTASSFTTTSTPTTTGSALSFVGWQVSMRVFGLVTLITLFGMW